MQRACTSSRYRHWTCTHFYRHHLYERFIDEVQFSSSWFFFGALFPLLTFMLFSFCCSCLICLCYISFFRSIHLNWIYDCRNSSSDWHFLINISNIAVKKTSTLEWVYRKSFIDSTDFGVEKRSGKVIDSWAKKKIPGGGFESFSVRFSPFLPAFVVVCSLVVILLQPLSQKRKKNSPKNLNDNRFFCWI